MIYSDIFHKYRFIEDKGKHFYRYARADDIESGQALFTPLPLRSEGLVPASAARGADADFHSRPTHASAAGSRTKDSRPPCDGILRQLRCLRMARFPAGRLAAVAAHRAGIGWGGNVGRYRAIHRLLDIYSRLSNVYSTGHTGASTVYSESIKSIINLLSSIGAIVPIGIMDTQG